MTFFHKGSVLIVHFINKFNLFAAVISGKESAQIFLPYYYFWFSNCYAGRYLSEIY